jgi:DNA-binding LytR/AlgR family response regulator
MFIRVHRSALVRVDRIGCIQRPGYGRLAVQMTTGQQVPVGRTYVTRIKQMIGNGPAVDTDLMTAA